MLQNLNQKNMWTLWVSCRRLENKLLDMQMEAKLVQIFFDTSSLQGNRTCCERNQERIEPNNPIRQHFCRRQHLQDFPSGASWVMVALDTVRDTIVGLAGGRHCCIGLGGVGFAPSNEDLAFRDGVCHLMNLFLRTMFKLRQGPVQFLGLFLATEQEEFFLKRPRFWNHFGSFFWAGNSTR